MGCRQRAAYRVISPAVGLEILVGVNSLGRIDTCQNPCIPLWYEIIGKSDPDPAADMDRTHLGPMTAKPRWLRTDGCWYRANRPRVMMAPCMRRMTKPFLPSIPGFCLLLLGACSATPPLSPDDAPAAPWSSAHHRAHPLVGRIWDTAAREFVEPAALIDALAAAPFILLGEKHDNPDHHRIQAWIVRALARKGRRPTLALEMFDSDQDEKLAVFLKRSGRDAAGLGPAVGWSESGWPDWDMYRPIAQAALDRKLGIVSANLPRRRVRVVSQEGLAALPAEEVRALGLDLAMPPHLMRAMRASIGRSHCGQIPEAAIGRLTTAQIVRDAHMARAMFDAAAAPGADGAILIAGAGHARSDYAVPWHLRQRAPNRATAAVALREVSGTLSRPGDYAGESATEQPAFDFLWFTPRLETVDPCERFAKQLRRLGHRKGEDATD